MVVSISANPNQIDSGNERYELSRELPLNDCITIEQIQQHQSPKEITAVKQNAELDGDKDVLIVQNKHFIQQEKVRVSLSLRTKYCGRRHV